MTEKEYQIIIAYYRELDEKHQKHLQIIDEKIEKIKKEKEELRRALNEKGFNIPHGLTLSEWIPHIRLGDGT